MGCSCRGKCRFEQNASHAFHKGKKMCSTCEKAIDTTDLKCYCCNMKLRLGAHKDKYRQKRVDNAVRL